MALQCLGRARDDAVLWLPITTICERLDLSNKFVIVVALPTSPWMEVTLAASALRPTIITIKGTDLNLYALHKCLRIVAGSNLLSQCLAGTIHIHPIGREHRL